MKKSAAASERIVISVVAVGIIGFIVYLIVRNEPFADPNLVVATRVLLSLGVAALGATIPGFLDVSWRGIGFAIRAGGALALFVLTFLLTPKVLPQLSNEMAERQLQEEIMIAEDRAARIQSDMEGRKDQLLEALVIRKVAQHPEMANAKDLMKAEAKFTIEYEEFSERVNRAIERFKELHAQYLDAIRSRQRIRANELRNEIQTQQLRFDLDTMVTLSDSSVSLTHQLAQHIEHEFKSKAYMEDPIPGNVSVQKILGEVRAIKISQSDAAALPDATVAPLGARARAVGVCSFARPGRGSNDRSAIVLSAGGFAESEIAWFEWGWGKQLAELCQSPTSTLTVVGTVADRSGSITTLQLSTIPGRTPEPYRYYDPHVNSKIELQ